MTKPDENHVTATVVVSGAPYSIRINIHEPVANLVKQALHDSGNQGQPASEWELRRVDGSLIDQNGNISQAGITNGMTLFLTPRAGVGG